MIDELNVRRQHAALRQYPWLVTGGVEKAIQKYDAGLGYAVSHLISQSRCTRKVDDTFDRIGVYDLLAEEKCASIRQMMDNAAPELHHFDYRMACLRDILTEPLDRAIVSYFKSEYVPLWMRFEKINPGEATERYSFHWHCDSGPWKHLKLLLYLNASEQSGGSTQFLDYASTQKFKAIGYVYCPLIFRLKDLSELARLCDIPFKPISFQMSAGQGLLFEPGHLLHKGIWPTHAPRYVVQVCLVPAAIPWQKLCREGGLPNKDSGFVKLI